MVNLKNMFVFSVFFVLLTSMSVSATAEDKESDAIKPKVIALTQEEVAKCIKVLPQFMKEFPEFNPVIGANAKNTEKPDMAKLISDTNLDALDAFAKKHGYVDFKEFGKHFSGVIAGYMYYKSKEAQKMLQEQLKTLPPETIALFQAQMEPMNATVEKLKATVTPEVLKAVKPYIPVMNKIMGIP